MTKKQIEKILAKRQAGSFCRVVVDRPAETLANYPHELRKRTEYAFQLVAYAKRKPVAEGVATGKRDAPELPAWVKRSEILPNGFKFWHGHGGQIYLALPVFGNNANFPIQFFRNGRRVKTETILPVLTAKERKQLEIVSGEKEMRESNWQAVARAVKIENVSGIF